MARMLMPLNGETDRDDDLSLFRELQKRKNAHNSSLLHSVSDDYEFDTSGRFSLYRIPSGKKESGHEFLAVSQKNDYDWLKTPPATPLFPSLEMEPSAPPHQLVLQKEMPIIQPLSRFTGSDMEASKPNISDGRANNMNSSSKAKLPTQSKIPTHNKQKQSINNVTAMESKKTNSQVSGTHSSISSSEKKPQHVAATNAKATTQKQSRDADFLASNLRKSMEASESQKKLPKARGVSPVVRSRVNVANMAEFSNETPPNLRTDQRTISSTRERISKIPTSDDLTTDQRSISSSQGQIDKIPTSDDLKKDQRSISSTRGRIGKIPISDDLKTDQRSISSTRGRIGKIPTLDDSGFQKRNSTTPRTSRLSRSPSPGVSKDWNQPEGTQKNLSFQKERSTSTFGTNEGSGTHVMGSKMVERVVNARKSGINVQAEKETKPKPLKYMERAEKERRMLYR